MTEQPTLTGQDIGEAEGAMTALLERAIAPEGRSRAEYIALRVLAARAPFDTVGELSDHLAGERQLGLGRADAEALVDRLRGEGLVSDAPVGLTPAGRAELDALAAVVAPVSRALFTGFDPAELAVAHRVLVELTERARAVGGAS